MVTSMVIGLLDGRYELGGWEILLPIAMIANYVIYYLWSDSQVRKHEVEHLTLGYYAHKDRNIPPEQLRKYEQLKYEYVMNVLKNTILFAVLCGGLVVAGQQLAKGTLMWLWLVLLVLLPLGVALIMQNQKHQISRFGKNGTNLMSR